MIKIGITNVYLEMVEFRRFQHLKQLQQLETLAQTQTAYYLPKVALKWEFRYCDRRNEVSLSLVACFISIQFNFNHR